MSNKRQQYSPQFKAKVALEAIKADKTVSELASQYELHPTLINGWKRQLLEQAGQIFEAGNKGQKGQENSQAEINELYRQIGQLKVERDGQLTVSRATAHPCPQLPKGFCSGLYRKSNHINLEISRKVSRQIIEFAKTYRVKVIVIENLSGWKAKAGRKGTLLKQKFHLWCHQKIVENLTNRWTELGGVVQTINPKYTSAYAFDGSGKVRRSKTNYSLCTFSSGKQYNADLSASYNIGARYWYSVLIGDKDFSRVFVSQSSPNTLRTPITLGTLRSFTTF